MIHWQYIKGAYQNSSSQSNIPYTFMDFYGGNDYAGTSTTITQSMMPKIWLATDTSRTNPKSAGYIITSAVLSQSINGTLSMSDANVSNVFKNNLIKSLDAKELLHFYATETPQRLVIGADPLSIWIGPNNNNGSITGYGTWFINKTLVINNAFSSSPKRNSGDLSAKAIYSEGLCEAQYFNATSDRRAKDKITPITQSVLPLIKNTQLYSFIYKDLDTPSIGIIAQDVQDVDFNGFSLVDNKEATGKDMDYMSIHESKLIYVLWKAVQEQQAEIEELKRQLKKD